MKRSIAFVLAAAAGLPVPAAAQEWEFILTPYVMAPAMAGKAGIGPVETQVSVSPVDIFSNLNWGVMGIAEVNNGRFGVAIDATYMNLEATRDGAIDRIGGHQGAYTGMVLARVSPHAEIYAGARFNDIGLRISATGPLGNPRSASQSKSWVDPIVGMRVNLPFSETTDLTVLMDAGGFGLSSDIAVQFWPSAGFRLGRRTRAQLGYRLVYTDYESGSGLRRFSYDVLTHGPTAGIQLRF